MRVKVSYISNATHSCQLAADVIPSSGRRDGWHLLLTLTVFLHGRWDVWSAVGKGQERAGVSKKSSFALALTFAR